MNKIHQSFEYSFHEVSNSSQNIPFDFSDKVDDFSSEVSNVIKPAPDFQKKIKKIKTLQSENKENFLALDLTKIRTFLGKDFSEKERIELVSVLLQMGLNEKQKKAITKGQKLAMPELLTETGFSDEEIEFLAKANVIERRQPIYKIRDQLTGFRGKSMILSNLGIDYINQKIKGEKLFVFLDFDNMGPPNDFGLGSEVDKFIKYFGNLSREMFSDIPSEFLRLGGDEFGIFLPDTPKAIERYNEFFEVLENKRKEIFNTKKQGINLENTLEKVERRTGMRKIRKSKVLEQTEVNFTIEDFVDSMKEEGAFLPQEAENFSKKRQSGLLQKNLAEKLETKGCNILTNSRGLIRVGESPDLFKIAWAKEEIEKLIKQYKPFGKTVPNVILENKKIKNLPKTTDKMTDGEYEIYSYQEHEKLFNSLREKYLKNPVLRDLLEAFVHEMKFVDPSITSVLRLDLVKDQTAQELLKIKESQEFSILTIDVFAFGAFNNNEGYSRGDFILRKIVEIVKETIQPQRLVRLGGGGLKIINPGKINSEVIELLQKKLKTFWLSLEHKQTTIAEASEKQALAESSTKPLTPKFLFEDLSIYKKIVEIKPEESMAKILGNKK